VRQVSVGVNLTKLDEAALEPNPAWSDRYDDANQGFGLYFAYRDFG